jgi:hypothetical protein
MKQAEIPEQSARLVTRVPASGLVAEGGVPLVCDRGTTTSGCLCWRALRKTPLQRERSVARERQGYGFSSNAAIERPDLWKGTPRAARMCDSGQSDKGLAT